MGNLIKNAFNSSIAEITRPLRTIGLKIGKGPTGIDAFKEGFTAPIKSFNKDLKSLGIGGESGLQIPLG